MLTQLDIRNFQSHYSTQVVLSPGVTAFIGLNNHGKSSILRAFQKVIRNEPEGNTFISDGETCCEITLTTDKGIVTRSVKNDLSADKNKYVLNNVDEYVGFGDGIPLEILPSLATSLPQQFGDITVDFNFQSQQDLLFLMQGDGLASKRGKILGSVTGVDVINRAIQLCGAEIKSTKSSIAKTQVQVQTLTSQLEKYVDIPVLQEQIINLLASASQLEADYALQDQHATILRSIERILESSSGVVKLLDVISTEKVEAGIATVKTIGAQVEVCKHLQQIGEKWRVATTVLELPEPPDLSSYTLCKQQRDAAHSILQKKQRLDTIHRELERLQGIEGLLEHQETLKSLQLSLNNHNGIYTRCLTIQANIETSEDAIKICQEDLSVAEHELAEFQELLQVCPTCKRPFLECMK